MEYEHIVHSFEPIFDSASQILILGTLPSVKSRETNFYYGHKQNRFWKVLESLNSAICWNSSIQTTILQPFFCAIFSGSCKISSILLLLGFISSDMEKSVMGSVPIEILGLIRERNNLACSSHSSNFEDVCLRIAEANAS